MSGTVVSGGKKRGVGVNHAKLMSHQADAKIPASDSMRAQRGGFVSHVIWTRLPRCACFGSRINPWIKQMTRDGTKDLNHNSTF